MLEPEARYLKPTDIIKSPVSLFNRDTQSRRNLENHRILFMLGQVRTLAYHRTLTNSQTSTSCPNSTYTHYRRAKNPVVKSDRGSITRTTKACSQRSDRLAGEKRSRGGLACVKCTHIFATESSTLFQASYLNKQRFLHIKAFLPPKTSRSRKRKGQAPRVLSSNRLTGKPSASRVTKLIQNHIA